MKKLLTALLGMLLFAGLNQANASTLQLDFDISFGDPLDPNTEAPDGAGPYLTALFDDNNSAGSVTLTLTVAGDVGAAEVTGVYLNVDDAIGAENLTITKTGGTGPTPINIGQITNDFKAANDGLFDILIDLPPPGGDRFGAGETLVFDITFAGLVAGDFNYLSAPDPLELDPSGPFLGAAKFASTGLCTIDPEFPNDPCSYENSDWVGVVPVPAAAWLFGSGLLGLVGIARRKKA